MDGIPFNDRDFFQEQREGDRCWKWPLNLAIGLHLAVFTGSVYLPDLMERKPLPDNVITIDLISLPELASQAAPALKIAKPVAPARQAEPEVVEQPAESKVPEISIAPLQRNPEPVVAAEPISLKPMKRKVRVAKDTRLVEEKERDRRARAIRQEAVKQKQEALAQKKRDQLAQKRAAEKKKRALAAAEKRTTERKKRALTAARQAEQDADRAAANARQELASVIRENNAISQSGRATGTASSGRSGNTSAIKNQYFAQVNNRISSYWQVPEMVKKSSNLKTRVALTVLRDGSVTGIHIDQKSGNTFLDQSALRALRDASPMPGFPALMTESSVEFELYFTPQGLTM